MVSDLGFRISGLGVGFEWLRLLMGVYSTTRTKFPCAQCREPFDADVQFKTGREHGTLPEYVEGELAEDSGAWHLRWSDGLVLQLLLNELARR